MMMESKSSLQDISWLVNLSVFFYPFFSSFNITSSMLGFVSEPCLTFLEKVYFSTLNNSTNGIIITVGDIVILKEYQPSGLWPKLLKYTALVRVATVKTATGMYKRPISKIALLLPHAAEQ